MAYAGPVAQGSADAGDGGRQAVLILMSDTGGGHRRAAEAVAVALGQRYPGRFRPVLCDPLAGPASAWPLRWLARLYGPLIRRTPWAWGAAYHLTNSRAVMAVLWRTVFAFADRPVRRAVAEARPAVIVSCHPLTGRAAIRAARRAPGTPVVTAITDLVSVHASWRYPGANQVAVATPQAGAVVRAALPGVPCVQTGLPVAVPADACSHALPAANVRPAVPERSGGSERAVRRRKLGIPESAIVVLLTGGAEGCGRLGRRTRAILGSLAEVHVVTVCGRNARLLRRLRKLRESGRLPAARLTVLGFADAMTDWLRSADVVVTKAGPGILAEAACCATPILVTSHLPGQERGNGGLVIRAGAGLSVRGIGDMVRALAELSSDPVTLARMRAASGALARPEAAAAVADLVAARCAGVDGQHADAQHAGAVAPVQAAAP